MTTAYVTQNLIVLVILLIVVAALGAGLYWLAGRD